MAPDFLRAPEQASNIAKGGSLAPLCIICCSAEKESTDMAPSVMAAIPALKETYAGLKGRMDKAVEDFRFNLASTRTGRASVHMLDSVKVPYYGTEMPLNQIAQIHAAEA